MSRPFPEIDLSPLTSAATALAATQATQATTLATITSTQSTQDTAIAGKIDKPASATQGDLLQYDGTAWVRLPRGNVGQVLVRLPSGLLGWVTPLVNIF